MVLITRKLRVDFSFLFIGAMNVTSKLVIESKKKNRKLIFESKNHVM